MKLQDREFFRRDVLCVAPDLVGRILVRRLPDGTLDYENPDTLDLPLIKDRKSVV